MTGAGPMDSLGAKSVVVEGAREARHFADAEASVSAVIGGNHSRSARSSGCFASFTATVLDHLLRKQQQIISYCRVFGGRTFGCESQKCVLGICRDVPV